MRFQTPARSGRPGLWLSGHGVCLLLSGVLRAKHMAFLRCICYNQFIGAAENPLKPA